MMAYLADIGVLELELLTANKAKSIGRLKVPLRFREVFDRVPQLPQELATERHGEDGKATIQGDFAVWGASKSEAGDGRKEFVLGSISLALHLRFGQHSLIRQTLQQSKLASASNANNDSSRSSYDCTVDTDLKIPAAMGGEEGGASNRGWTLAPVMSSFQLHEALVAADINDTLPRFPNALTETAKRPNARSSGRTGQRPRYVPPDARGEATAVLPLPSSQQRYVPPSQQQQRHQQSQQQSQHHVQHNDVEVKEQKHARLPSPPPPHQANVAKHASHPRSSEEVSSVGTSSRRGSGSVREATYEVASAADPIEIDLQLPTQDDTEPSPVEPPPLRPPPSLGEPPQSVLPSEFGSEAKVAQDDDDRQLEQLLRRGLELRAAIGAAFGPTPPPQGPSGSTANLSQSENDQNRPPGFLFGGSGGSKEVEPPPQQSSETAQPRQSAHPRNDKLPSTLTSSSADLAKTLAGLDASKAAELNGVVEKLRMAGRVPGGGGGSVGDDGHTAATPGGTTMDGWEWAMEEAMVAEEGLADEKALEALLDKVKNIPKMEHCPLQ